MSLSRTWIVIAIIIIRNEFGVSEKSTLSLHKGECVTTQDENPYSLLNYAVREWRHDDLPPACLPAARNNNNTANIGVDRYFSQNRQNVIISTSWIYFKQRP